MFHRYHKESEDKKRLMMEIYQREFFDPLANERELRIRREYAEVLEARAAEATDAERKAYFEGLAQQVRATLED
jgi:hypothetical protein